MFVFSPSCVIIYLVFVGYIEGNNPFYDFKLIILTIQSNVTMSLGYQKVRNPQIDITNLLAFVGMYNAETLS
jgi:hypothetical protein